MPDEEAAAGRGGTCQFVGELLVPENTFGRGPKAQRALNCSRCCLAVLYVFLLLVFIVSMVMYLRGRVEIVDHRMKFSKLEAPSIAICPWNAGDAVTQHHNASYTIYAVKFALDGPQRLPNKPRECQYDRVCQCLDLMDVDLVDVDDDHKGASGMSSVEIQNFRERIEIHTTLMDPSPVRTLKFGFYDSVDRRPSWYFGRQFYFLLGQMRMDSWMVSQLHDQNMVAMLTGDFSKLDRRHFYSYQFSDTDASMEVDENHQRSTRFSYEFRTFFVVETISAQSAISLFTIVALLLLLIALSNALMIWEMLFPIYVDGKVKRQVTPALQFWSRICCCTALEHSHDDQEEDGKNRIGYGATDTAT